MSQSMVDSHNPYFFKQRNERQYYRRLRKTFDEFSIFEDRREQYLASGIDAESVASGPAGCRRRRLSARPISASARRVSIADPPTLPPVDPTGPNLVSQEALDGLETKSIHSEKKADVTAQPSEGHSKEPAKLVEKDKFSQAKFASSSILSNLGKHLSTVSSDFTISLPVELLNTLTQTYQQLTTGAAVERREWQTDCYLDFRPKNRWPLVTGTSNTPTTSARGEHGSSLPKSTRQGQKQAAQKRVRMDTSRTTSLSPTRRSFSSPERPLTAGSVASNISFRSDTSSVEDGESRYEYDMLPAELRMMAPHYQQGRQTPRSRMAGPKSPLHAKQKSAAAEMKAKSKEPL